MNIAPYYFLYGGFWDGSLRGIGYNTRYITNAVTSGVTAYSLYFNGHGGPDSQHGGDNRSEGYSIRCVLR